MRKINLTFFKKLPDAQKRITLSSWVTLIRVFLVPFIVSAMIAQRWGIAFGLFVIASLTDMIDGNLARLRNEKTFLGAFLDPVADKFLLLSVFFTLAFVQSPLFSIPQWFVWLILFKELLQAVGFMIVYWVNGHIKIEPRLIGKITTLMQMCFVMWLFACYFFNWVPKKTYSAMLGILVFLVLGSLIQYTYMGWQWVLTERT